MIRMFSCSLRSVLLLAALSSLLITVLVSGGNRYGYRMPRLPKISFESDDYSSVELLTPAPSPPEPIKDAVEDVAIAPLVPLPEPAGSKSHPIDELLKRANDQFDDMSGRATSGIQEAVDSYVKRRGRQPPPRFDQWVQFAEENEALVIEDFFDQIYEDLAPLEAISAKTLREATQAWPYWLTLRDGPVGNQAER